MTRKVFIDEAGTELSFKINDRDNKLVIWIKLVDLTEVVISLDNSDAHEFISELYKVRKSL